MIKNIQNERRNWEQLEGKTRVSYENQSEISELKLVNYLGTFYILICGTFRVELAFIKEHFLFCHI